MVCFSIRNSTFSLDIVTQMGQRCIICMNIYLFTETVIPSSYYEMHDMRGIESRPS